MITKIATGFLGIVSLVAASLTHANTVSFVEGTNILTGGVSPITLTLQGTFDTAAVDAGDMIISWNSGVLDLVSAAAKPSWTIFTDPITPGASSFGFSVTWDGSGSNSGTNQQFASFTFDVVGGPGSFSDVITVSDNISFAGWSGPTGSDLPTTYIPIQVGVSAVPVPPAVWLFGSGLVGLVAVSRRRRMTQPV